MSSFASIIVGAGLLLQFVAIRVFSWADSTRVLLFGRELHLGCWFRERFGVPCPACGMTRSVILTLHGHFVQGFQLNAGGPVLVAAVAACAALLIVRGRSENTTSSRTPALVMIAFGWLFAAVLVGQWLIRIT